MPFKKYSCVLLRYLRELLRYVKQIVMLEEICYYCHHSAEWGYDGLGWCYKNKIKRLVQEDSTCDEYKEPIEEEEDLEYENMGIS